MSKLEGAVVLVVGASGGLGSRIAAQLESAGAQVIRAARNPETLSGTNSLLGDLTRTGGPATIVNSAGAVHGQLDGVVIAAGSVAFGPVAEITDATIDELFEINAVAPIRIIRESLPLLAASASAGREPFIVTFSGVVAETPTAGLAVYSAAKAALAGFMKAATRELRRDGMRMLDVRPGHTETGLATRPIAGTAPAFPAGLDPDAVASRIVKAIVDGEKDLPSTAF